MNEKNLQGPKQRYAMCIVIWVRLPVFGVVCRVSLFGSYFVMWLLCSHIGGPGLSSSWEVSLRVVVAGGGGGRVVVDGGGGGSVRVCWQRHVAMLCHAQP